MMGIVLPLTFLICIFWMLIGFGFNTEEKFDRTTKLPLYKQLIILGLTYSPLTPLLVLLITLIYACFYWVYEKSRINKVFNWFFGWLWESK